MFFIPRWLKLAVAFAVFFLLLVPQYARSQKKKYYNLALDAFSQGQRAYCDAKFYLAYDHYDRAIKAASDAKNLENLKSSERKNLDFISRQSHTQKLRILEVTRNFQKMVAHNQLCRGMSREQVILSWGEPLDIEKKVYQWEEYEDWFYGSPLKNSDMWVLFKDGHVVDWRDAQ